MADFLRGCAGREALRSTFRITAPFFAFFGVCAHVRVCHKENATNVVGQLSVSPPHTQTAQNKVKERKEEGQQRKQRVLCRAATLCLCL